MAMALRLRSPRLRRHMRLLVLGIEILLVEGPGLLDRLFGQLLGFVFPEVGWLVGLPVAVLFLHLELSSRTLRGS